MRAFISNRMATGTSFFFFCLLVGTGCDSQLVGNENVLADHYNQDLSDGTSVSTGRRLLDRTSYRSEGSSIHLIYFIPLSVLLIPLTLCCITRTECGKQCLAKCIIRAYGGKGLPVDVVPLPEWEAKRIMDLLQGEWRIIPMSGISAGESGVTTQTRFATPVAYERGVIKGDQLILSGGIGSKGRPLPTQTQTISLSRSSDGIIYLDKLGSYLDMENIDDIQRTGTMDIVNALGMNMQMKRVTDPGPAAGVQSVADELVKLHNLKMQGILTEEEFETEKKRLLEGQYSNTRSLFARPVRGDGDYMPMGGSAPEDEEEEDEEDEESESDG